MVCRDKKSECHINFQEVKPWFNWVECNICEKEFRREVIFKTQSIDLYNYAGVYSPGRQINYFCKRCCPTKKDAWEA